MTCHSSNCFSIVGVMETHHWWLLFRAGATSTDELVICAGCARIAWFPRATSNRFRATAYLLDCKTVGFFLKISKEIVKAWGTSPTRAKRASLTRPTGSPQSRSLFSASFQNFCLTARAYLNTQKYGLVFSLRGCLLLPILNLNAFNCPYFIHFCYSLTLASNINRQV